LTSISSIAHVGAGHDHSLAVTSGGVVYTWGENGFSQLGDGTDVDRAIPTAISDSGFDWKVSTPTFNVAAGLYNVNKTVTIAITTAGATIRYTQNGNEPTESDSSIASGSSVTVSTSQTLKAKAFKSGMAASNATSAAYELKVIAVSITPANNTYTTTQSMQMSTTTSDATVHYTISDDPAVSPPTPRVDGSHRR
jgi:chitinase